MECFMKLCCEKQIFCWSVNRIGVLHKLYLLKISEMTFSKTCTPKIKLILGFPQCSIFRRISAASRTDTSSHKEHEWKSFTRALNNRHGNSVNKLKSENYCKQKSRADKFNSSSCENLKISKIEDHNMNFRLQSPYCSTFKIPQQQKGKLAVKN